MLLGDFDTKKDGIYIIAELSANHSGSKDLAIESIYAAKESGANAIKLQTYTPDTLTLNSNHADFIVKGGTLWDNKTLYELYQEAHTPWEWHAELFAEAKKADIDIFSSPFDKTAVDFLEQFNPIAYKIASFEMTDYDLISYVASQNRPIIFSAGIATDEEIKAALAICRSHDNQNIALLKCTSTYPATLDKLNLQTISHYKKTYGIEIGYSDHSEGQIAPIVATSLGAVIVEKHFMLSKSIDSVDSEFSLDAVEFAQMVQNIRNAHKTLGQIQENKEDDNRQFARSLYVSANIKKGCAFTVDNIKSVRPGYGLHPKYLPTLLGKKAQKDYAFAQRLELEDIC